MNLQSRTKRCLIVFVLSGVIAFVGMGYYFKGPGNYIPLACPIYHLTGLYCPGCGAGRATYEILHGQIRKALGLNPLMVIIMPCLALYYIVVTIQWIVTGREYISDKISWKIPTMIMIIIIIYGVIRNIPMYPFTYLAPK